MNENAKLPLNVHHFVRDGMDRTDTGLLEIEELNEMVNDALANGDRGTAEKIATEAAAMMSLAPEAWERIVGRLSGVNTVGKLRDDMLCPKELPFMFTSWAEYRDYLVENLVTEEADREDFRKLWRRGEGKYDAETTEKLHRMQVKAVLANDHWGVKIGSFENSHQKNVVGGVANDRYHERQAAKRKDRETTKLLIGKRVGG